MTTSLFMNITCKQKEDISVLPEGTENCSLMCLCVVGMGSLYQTSEGKPLPPRERWQLFAVTADRRQLRAERSVSTSDLFPVDNPSPFGSSCERCMCCLPCFSFFPLKSRLLTFGSAVEVTGVLKKSPNQKQPVEVHADQIHVIGECNPVVRNRLLKHPTHILLTRCASFK